jgi:hypothetical protein
MVADSHSRFTFLAADLLSAAQPSPTPLQKTRVGGFRRHASGRLSRRGRCRSIITPGSRACAYKTVSGRHEWPNRDPLGEPGFETLHLVSQPLFIRKLRLNINDTETQFLLAMAMQNGSIDVSSYLRNSHTSYRGNSISALAFFDILRNGQGNYAPNWPAELLEYPNLYEYVGNDPINGIDPFGLTWWKPWTWNWVKALWEPVSNVTEGGTYLGGADCMAGVAGLMPGMTNRNAGIYNTPPSGSDGDYNPPMQNGGGNGSYKP